MSYDLAVWDGPQPASDDAAAELYERLMDRLEADSETAGPTPRISAYVEALLARWPDITEHANDDSPWADSPLMGNAFGDAIYFSMVWSRAEEASEYAAQLAAEHGLVCFDPQAESLRPRPPEAEVVRRRSWFRRSR